MAAELRAAGATVILLIGSLAADSPEETGFHAHSHVDIAVAGVDAGVRGRVETRLLDRCRRVVELFRLQDLPESFVRRIRSEGRKL
jgi:single-stranded DNA-specific DHH superfamily exonuclease